MASVGHLAVGMTAARLHHRKSPRDASALLASMLGWSALSFLPDLDVVGFSFGIRYGDPWGHRGATHSFAFAAVLGLLAGIVTRRAGMGLLTACVIASHAVLDTLTDGGRGCALWWPFTDERYFAPWNPIPVAPIGLGFVSPRGLSVLMTELVLFAPLLLYGLWGLVSQRSNGECD